MQPYILNFSIRLLKQSLKSDPFALKGNTTIYEIKSDKSLLNPNASVILADPYLFVWKEKLYLFYEHQNKWYGKGRICMRSTSDLIKWTDEKDVLIEPFHLSFPYVFEDNGKVYMLPETGVNKTISLYEATDDTLTNWKRKKVLVEDDIPWYDSTIFKSGDMYYLFSGRFGVDKLSQHLFLSDNLLGPYSEHKMSPICVGFDCARNAGSIIEYKKMLYRPAQVCVGSYGENVSIYRIMELTPSKYSEEALQTNILPSEMYSFGGHQFNMVEFAGYRIIATDYREKNFNLIELTRRIIKKIK